MDFERFGKHFADAECERFQRQCVSGCGCSGRWIIHADGYRDFGGWFADGNGQRECAVPCGSIELSDFARHHADGVVGFAAKATE